MLNDLNFDFDYKYFTNIYKWMDVNNSLLIELQDLIKFLTV